MSAKLASADPTPVGPAPSGHHVLTVLVENKSGVLSRVAGLFSRRGFNIFSLAVSPTNDARFSRMTIVVDAEDTPLEQVVKQLHKLIPVIKITELRAGTGIERELLLAAVEIDTSKRHQVLELANLFSAQIAAVTSSSMVISLAGTPDDLDAFTVLLEPFEVLELQRTGRVALTRP